MPVTVPSGSLLTPGGAQGVPGEPGPPGGPPGPQGDAATISAGLTTTGEPGTQAEVVNTGTEQAAVFEFTIPRGDKGDTGNKGDKGDVGVTGSPGMDGNAIGTISIWPSSVPPTGYLNCDGSEQLIADYPELSGVLGEIYGVASDPSLFKLPDFRSRTAIGQGQGPGGLTDRVIGVRGGEETHVLTVAELAIHNHTATATQGTHTHSDSGHQHYSAGVDHTHWCSGVDHLHGDDHYHGIGAGQFNHTHPGNIRSAQGLYQGGSQWTAYTDGGLPAIPAATLPAGGTNWKSQQGYGASTGACDRSMAFWSAAADRSLAQWTDVRYAAISTVSAGAITVSVANIGGGANHNNMSPFLVINYVIRAVAAALSDLSALKSELQSLRSELNELKKLLL